MVCLALGVAALSACGGGDKKITYEGGSLTAVVGEASSATVATATGADGITYALKEGSSLPSQLTLGSDGKITGTPSEATSSPVKFTVVATAGSASAEAEFTITVYPAGTTVMTFRMEAEGAILDDATTMAGSFTPQTVRSNEKASGGKHLSDLGQAGCKVLFEFTSSAETTATLTVCVKSSMSTEFVVNTSTFKILVNGREVNFRSATATANDFITISTREAVTLNDGDNTIELVLPDNDVNMLNATPVMPHIDYVELAGAATFNWEPEDNE